MTITRICFAVADKWLENKTAYIFSFVLIKQGNKIEGVVLNTGYIF